MSMQIRAKGVTSAWKTCRSFGLGWWHSLYRSARFLVTGRTGKYRIKWNRGLW